MSMELSVDEKLGIMENEYSIAVDDRIREDVSEMCNLRRGSGKKAELRAELKKDREIFDGLLSCLYII